MHKLLTIITTIFFVSTAVASVEKYVKADVLNIRVGAGENYDVVGQEEKGAEVKVLSELGEWTEIETESGVHGYVASQFLEEGKRKLQQKKFQHSGKIILLVVIALLTVFGGSSAVKSKSTSSSSKSIKDTLFRPIPKKAPIQYIRNNSGRILGTIKDVNGQLQISNPSGRILGTYDPNTDTTKLSNGKIIAKGNVLTTLL